MHWQDKTLLAIQLSHASIWTGDFAWYEPDATQQWCSVNDLCNCFFSMYMLELCIQCLMLEDSYAFNDVRFTSSCVHKGQRTAYHFGCDACIHPNNV